MAIPKPKVLVVGDWLVDEYWVLGEQRSRFSRRRGQRHMLALQTPSSSIRRLGGAGLATSILGQTKLQEPDGSEVKFDVTGIGRWHPDDDAAIGHLLSEDHSEQTHHRLSFPTPPTPHSNVKLTNLSNSVRSTTRVIRLFHRYGPRLELIQRIDWEEPSSTVHQHDFKTRSDITDVVIVDLGKGVVTSALVKDVLSSAPKARIHVFSKYFLPEWRNGMDGCGERVKLLFISETAAQQAMKKSGPEGKEWSSSSWIVSRKLPSADALFTLRQLASEYKHAHVVVAPSGMSLLASRAEGSEVSIQPDGSHGEFEDLVPMSTVLFPTIVAHLAHLAASRTETPDLFKAIVERSLSFTHHWMVTEAKRFSDFTFQPQKQQVCAIVRGGGKSPTTTMYCNVDGCKPVQEYRKLIPTNTEREEDAWRQSMKGLGIVDKSNAKTNCDVFQLWRGMTDLDGYVTCVPHKRRILQSLVHITKHFSSRRDHQHESVLLIDQPGSGKSFLVERLEKALGIRRIEFNITQLLDRHDLLRCFDTIVTTQAQSPESPLLVFFDEINALLGGYHVYNSFLAPLEQGVYERSGNRFHIQPCLWVFAGTELPTVSVDGSERDKSEKGSDFCSRLGHPPFHLSTGDKSDIGVRDGELEIIERIYLGISTLRAVFHDVTHVSRTVLSILAKLKQDLGPREIRRLIRGLRDIQRGQVTVYNLPELWWRETLYTEPEATELVRNAKETDMIEIEYQPRLSK